MKLRTSLSVSESDFSLTSFFEVISMAFFFRSHPNIGSRDSIYSFVYSMSSASFSSPFCCVSMSSFAFVATGPICIAIYRSPVMVLRYSRRCFLSAKKSSLSAFVLYNFLPSSFAFRAKKLNACTAFLYLNILFLLVYHVSWFSPKVWIFV